MVVEMRTYETKQLPGIEDADGLVQWSDTCA